MILLTGTGSQASALLQLGWARTRERASGAGAGAFSLVQLEVGNVVTGFGVPEAAQLCVGLSSRAARDLLGEACLEGCSEDWSPSAMETG